MSKDADTSYNLSVEVTEGPDPDAAAASAVHSFGYLMRPPVWLGGSLQDGSTEDIAPCGTESQRQTSLSGSEHGAFETDSSSSTSRRGNQELRHPRRNAAIGTRFVNESAGVATS